MSFLGTILLPLILKWQNTVSFSIGLPQPGPPLPFHQCIRKPELIYVQRFGQSQTDLIGLWVRSGARLRLVLLINTYDEKNEKRNVMEWQEGMVVPVLGPTPERKVGSKPWEGLQVTACLVPRRSIAWSETPLGRVASLIDSSKLEDQVASLIDSSKLEDQAFPCIVSWP